MSSKKKAVVKKKAPTKKKAAPKKVAKKVTKKTLAAQKKKRPETKLVVLSAPSGSGKTTLASMIISRIPNFILSISCTTRPPRGSEQEGIHYFFVQEPQFVEMIKRGEFLEHAHVFGKYWYGTPKKFVENTLNSGRNVLFDIEVQGAKQLKNAYGSRCISIFVHPPSMQELENRLRKRATDSSASIEARLKTAADEIQQAPTFDYQIVNRDIEETFDRLVEILKQEHCHW